MLARAGCSPRAGPPLFGGPQERWFAAGAALDSADEQVFVRDRLRKLQPSGQGLGRLEAATPTPGELQLCLLLAARGLAAAVEEYGRRLHLLDPSLHQTLVESLAERGLSLRAAQPAA